MSRRLFASISAALALALAFAHAAPAPAKQQVVGGQLAQRSEAPWAVGLTTIDRRGREFSCTGSLITHYLVLTAAHCVKGQSRVYISAGSRRFRPWSRTHKRRASWFTYDSRYGSWAPNPNYAGYDFALVASSSYIRARTIRVNNSLSLPYGHYFNLFGWGTTDAASKRSTTRLHRGIIRLLYDSECGGRSAGAQLCVGWPETGTQSCHGDSGGPLTWGTGPQAVEVGVVSYGMDGACGAGRSIYGDTAASDWLQYWLHHYSVPGW